MSKIQEEDAKERVKKNEEVKFLCDKVCKANEKEREWRIPSKTSEFKEQVWFLEMELSKE